MTNCLKRVMVWLGPVVIGALGALGAGLGCGAPGGDAGVEASWSALMDDGDLGAMAAARPTPTPPPPRFCPSGDCSGDPLAFWKLDDCNTFSTELADSAFTTFIQHPAFRAVSVACVAGVSGQAVQIARDDDIVYAPDQPDFLFDQGLTIAAWIKPDRVTGTQSIVRKRLEGTSSFLLAIDGKRLNFVLRLGNGRVVGVTAPIQAGRFTHVAATYDGQQAILYVDGVAAARARAAGTIGPGVGPILVGNDANGRQMRGVIDEVWLNTLAAPADVIKGLTCIRQAPLVSLSPGATPPEVAGATAPFDLSVTNQSSASCPVEAFDFFASSVFPPLVPETFFGQVTAGPGQTAHATLNVKSSRMAAVGSYPFQYTVAADASSQLQATAQATYVVGTGPVACDGFAPQTPQIIGTPFSPAAGPPFTFAAPALAAPVVTPVLAPDGSTQALQVAVNPGVATDPANAFLGFGLGFGNPPCVDASAFTAVRFTITGDLGTCAPTFSVIVSEDNAVENGAFGTCTSGATGCLPPRSGPLTTGTNLIRFADLTGGTPLATVDATALNGVQWSLTAPTDGVTAPCVANFTISNVSFINENAAPLVNYTFDAGTQGWSFSDFNDATFTNLAVVTPPGGVPPTLAFDGADGNPNPGSLKVTARFTAFDQYVDPIVGFFPSSLDLSGKSLHAMIRLVSGSFAGGVQFHASSGPSFIFLGTFLDASSFQVGEWMPVTLDLAGGVPAGFDPSQVVQIGAQFFSGFSSGGGTFTGSGDTVFEIDTVTD